MHRRQFVQCLSALGVMGSFPALAQSGAATGAESVEDLPTLKGDLTLYLGRGEGGLYENIIEAIRKRNPELNLSIRQGTTAALANMIVAEAKAGVRRADLFWAVDSGSVAMVSDAGLAKPLPESIQSRIKEGFRYPNWAPVSGRIRTLPYSTERMQPDAIPDSIMAIADSDLTLGWAPAYVAFQSFVTGMRILQGDDETRRWLKAVSKRAKSYPGELGVVMAAERGEIDLGFANHYYTLRLKAGKPDAKVDIAFTKDDAGCLLNASGIIALRDDDLTTNFVRYLLTREAQGYLATEGYEIPMVSGVPPITGLPPLATISPPKVDLAQLADLRPTLDLMRDAGVL